MFRLLAASTVLSSAISYGISAPSLAQSGTPFVAADFRIPATLDTKEFRLGMLTVNDVVKDYDAVMTSVEHLKTIWPGGTWPEGLTFEQDLIDLGWHQKEFQMRRSFAYTVVTPSESLIVMLMLRRVTSLRGRGGPMCSQKDLHLFPATEGGGPLSVMPDPLRGGEGTAT